jgi:hypothetical protein
MYSIFSPLFLLSYINDLHKISTNKAKIIKYADDTSVIESNPSFQDFNIEFLGGGGWIRLSYKLGCLHPVACTRSGSGFLSNATLF